MSGCQERIVTRVQQRQTVQSPGAAGVCVLNTETLAYPSLTVTDSKTTKKPCIFFISTSILHVKLCSLDKQSRRNGLSYCVYL